MNIVHFSFSDTTGALGAAYELHRKEKDLGNNSIMIVREKTRDDDSVIELEYTDSKQERLLRLIDKLYFKNNRKLGTSFHSIDYLGLDWTHELKKVVEEADIIHIHWCMGLLSLNDIQQFLQMRKKIVWTMHDFHPMTGLCHCPESCIRYEENCSDCPQMVNTLENISQKLFEEKMHYYGNSSIHIVTASSWLKEIVERSSIFRNNNISVIPIGIDTEIFSIEKDTDIKQELGLREDSKIILIGAQSLNDNVKGYHFLKSIVENLFEFQEIKQLCVDNKLYIVTFGHNANLEINENIPIINLGFILERRRLAKIYNMANVFIFPSTFETFGMTAVEAMACGVPVVAFDISAMSEVIVNGVNGYKVKSGNTEEMAEKICYILKNSPIDSEKCRKRIYDEYSLLKETERMITLYNKIENETSPFIKKTEKSTEVELFFNKCIKEIVLDQAMNQHPRDSIEKIFWKYNNEYMTISRKVRNLYNARVITPQSCIHIYGAGKNGAILKKELDRFRIKIISFWDIDESKWGNTIGNIVITAPKDFESDKSAIVLISIVAYDEAEEYLSNKGFVLNKNMF